jgi:nucleoside-diphosphate-sugar epimerase
MTKILLTGATGFIGSNFLKHSKFQKIDILVRQEDFVRPKQKCIVGDMFDNMVLDRILDEEYDFIVHSAWSGLPARSSELNEKNLTLYSEAIKIFKANSKTMHIFLGTCLEYGTLNGRVTEDDQGVNLGSFALTKLKILNEVIKGGLNFSWLRLFYVYGGNQHSNSLLAHIMNCIKNGEEVNLREPSQLNDFIYIEDVIQAIDELIVKGTNNQIMNIGSGVSESNANIANLVLEQFGMQKKYETFVNRSDGLCANVDRARNYLNWEPKYSILEGVRRTINVGVND